MVPWLKGLAVAVIAGASQAVVAYNFSDVVNWKAVLSAALVGALTTGSAYLSKSPFPK